MVIKKKSLDTLKQQKKSFVNFIKTKEKYSEAIADLFFDDELEKIDDMEKIKQHLEEKWISKELIDSLETDYESYLGWQSFYWPIDDYPDDVKESIRENDKILKKIKKDLVKLYKENEKFMDFDVEWFVNKEFIIPGNHSVKKIWDSFYWSREISIKEQEKEKLERDIEKIDRELGMFRYQLKNAHWFQMWKKKRILEEIRQKEQEKINKEKKIESIGDVIKEYESKWKIAKYLESIRKRKYSDIVLIMWNNGKYSDIDEYKKAVDNINKELEKYLVYMTDEDVVKIKENIIKVIEENYKEQKQKIRLKMEKMLREYLNYYNYWKNEDSYSVKTIYSKNRIDLQIMQIANKLWIRISDNDLYNGEIDYDFMDDVFIHTTWFNVLDEILEEWWLISTNEAQKRSYNGSDIYDSITQKHAHHKDVYFSRGFRKNGYWHHEPSSKDFVFIANTMTNFANSGYWVPLNNTMQTNAWLQDIDAQHDIYWYSIISKSALNNTFRNDSYSKIDVKDFYIFVPEIKRKEIERNPKYRIANANIIYIPEKYKWEMNYQLYEFIKKEIALRDKEKLKKSPLPNEIVTYKDGIESIDSWYKWAFCSSVWENPETLFNPLKNWNYKEIVNFLKINQDVLWFSELKIFSNFEVDYQRLESFLDEQKVNIDSIELLFEYPKELLLLAIICTKLWLWWNSHSDGWKRSSLALIKNKIKEFGYSMKDIWIFCKTVEWIQYIVQFRDNFRYNKSMKMNYMNSVRTWCEEWSVDFNQMKDFLVKISDICLRNYDADLVKSILK